MKNNLLILSVSALALTSCASKLPTITYDASYPKQAVIAKEPAKPVEIVTMPQVLPLPDQLQPAPVPEKPDSRPPDSRSPMARVDEANKAAIQEPTQYGYINAIQVYPFTEGALYRLYAAPERVSDIALQPGEKLSSVSAGDTVRWIIGDTQSGSGESQQVHVLVKPFAPNLKTNLVIATDRRSYHVQMESTAKTFMAAKQAAPIARLTATSMRCARLYRSWHGSVMRRPGCPCWRSFPRFPSLRSRMNCRVRLSRRI